MLENYFIGRDEEFKESDIEGEFQRIKVEQAKYNHEL